MHLTGIIFQCSPFGLIPVISVEPLHQGVPALNFGRFQIVVSVVGAGYIRTDVHPVTPDIRYRNGYDYRNRTANSDGL